MSSKQYLIQQCLHGERGGDGSQYTEIVQVSGVFDPYTSRTRDPRTFRIEIDSERNSTWPKGEASVWTIASGWVEVCNVFELALDYEAISQDRPTTVEDFKADRDLLLETAMLVVFDGNK
jgi:hypothetical protein